MKALLLALRFLTRIPLPGRPEYRPRDWGRSALAYPLVGLLIGLVLAGMQSLLAGVDLQLQAALLVSGWALLTGGLHLDGLADSADAWVGGHGDRRRTLDIMKDPRSGPAGVAAVALTLLVKFAALAALLKTSPGQGLLLAPVLARAALIGLVLTTPYVRPGGMGAALAEHLPRTGAAGVLLGVAAGVAALAGWNGAMLLLTALAAGGLLRYLMVRRIGGATGDTLGASVELMETLVLVVLAIRTA
jgi:adenosylcobinamide-GDP ribazoletransferase